LRNLISADNTKIRQLEQSKVIRFRGSKPSTPNRPIHKQLVLGLPNQSTSGNAAEHKPASSSLTDPSDGFRNTSRQATEMDVKHVSVFEDLTVGVEEGFLSGIEQHKSQRELSDKVGLCEATPFREAKLELVNDQQQELDEL